MVIKKTKVRLTIISVGLAALLLVSAKYFFVDNRPLDVFLAVISTLGGHFTAYAEGYRESNFLSLRAGMTARQVEEIMGPPMSIGQWQEPIPDQPITPGEGSLHKLWHYSRAGKSTGNYWRREVWFKDAVVHRLGSGFYLD